ncbi:MAG: hypothetical protein WCZ29_25530 [Mycolicibacterium vanbaalenii]|uniref:hypothetical protein n=1 Tax=Mycolicibacterium vanbaalenii TaxID=110539 RepID=UPI0035690796
MSLDLPEYLLGGVLYGLGHFIRERDLAGRGVPAEVRAAHRWLTTMSAIGHQTRCDAEESEQDDLIGTAQAAALLGCTERHVRRIQADLDGARPAGRNLVFSRRQVIQYAQARKEHRGVA